MVFLLTTKNQAAPDSGLPVTCHKPLGDLDQQPSVLEQPRVETPKEKDAWQLP